MKKIISTLLIVLCLFSLVACKEDKNPVNEEPKKISSLVGTWRETIDNSKETEWYEIVITENSVSIWDCSWPFYDPVRNVVWEGTYPGDPEESFSEFEFSSPSNSQSDFIRTFKYSNGLLSVKKAQGIDRDITYKPIIECKKLEEETT